MLIKWIICRVPEAKRGAFDRAQQAWRRLSEVAGFRGQIGGWNADDPAVACILGLWAHYGAERNFMNDLHDVIVEATGQDEMYDESRVSRFEVMFEHAGSARTIQHASAEAGYLRVTECRVHFNRQAHYVQTQQEEVFPAMSGFDGLLHGCLCRSNDDPTHFLLVTWWRDQDACARWSLPEHPGRDPRSSDDVRSLEASIIAIDRAWSVPASDS